MAATWVEVANAPTLQRSSHVVSAIGSTVYVFGGELKPRQPRDNAIFKIPVQAATDNKHRSSDVVQTISAKATGEAPSPRVGAASTTFDNQIWLFSGRGGEAMAPIEENGALWVFDVAASKWHTVAPADTTAPHPEGRSYHAMTSDDAKIYVHAGCPTLGRLRDLWAFTVKTRQWKKLEDAPGSPRGGPSITYLDGKLYRMNGFDGKTEVGGAVDIYDIEKATWSTAEFVADGKSGPGARSVGALLPARIGGQQYLVTMFGESDPSSLGHQGAGKMLSDVWALNIDTSEWRQLETKGKAPSPRGWFDAAAINIDGSGSIVVSGGLDESNERLDDVWLLSFI
ncbi:Galactose oxidase, central domain [Teratosphaeria destructans]|uniref:Galactose oxidase, central domain n=1 Tax=Teratosphaeria destructans TaxID=418781 RepID=A0A9W7VXG8_9PEZI|nr:Galactose oxidase, central domain [Teratosphaeria destructans]